MVYVGLALYWLLQAYIWLLIARMIISWIPVVAPSWRPPGFLAAIFEFIYTLTDPPIKALRKVIPPLRLGSLSLDVGFMLVFVLCLVVQSLVVRLFF